MDRIEEARTLADDLELLWAGDLSEPAFRDKYTPRTSKGLVGVVWPDLEHYLSDADIRSRDDPYRSMQNAALAKLVRLLRSGAPDSELAAVHFLGRS